jgi:thiamine-phosphate pyrophosphorylase
MAQAPQPEARPTPRLYLITPEITDPAGFAGALAQALATADIAAVLLRLAEADERTLINRTKALAPPIQDTGAALILHRHAALVAKSGADGAHLTGLAAFTEAVGTLKPDRIAGCGGLNTRHDAMTVAEAGADYVMFGEPDETGARPSNGAILERVAWWAEVFQSPCVAYAASLEEIDAFVAAGADFVAIGNCIWDDTRGPAAALADVVRRLAAEPVR